jgi:hypothetical protein
LQTPKKNLSKNQTKKKKKKKKKRGGVDGFVELILEQGAVSFLSICYIPLCVRHAKGFSSSR